MIPLEQLRLEFDKAVSGTGLAGADRLCQACVELLEVDGAAISLLYEGVTRGTYGSSGELSRRLDELQFTFGEGPCLDAVSEAQPVMAGDLGRPGESRWPAFAGAVLELGVRAVFALPVSVAGAPVGALDLFRREPGALNLHELNGGLLAAEMAGVPLLKLMHAAVDWDDDNDGSGWEDLASLERVEVYQATGMIMGQLDVGPTEALVRLRGYAFAHGMTASEVAWNIVERRLVLDSDEPGSPPSDGGDQ